MAQLGAVLFDMDGVILDSEPFHEGVFVEFARQLGLAFTPAQYRPLIGMSSLNQWQLLKEEYRLDGTPQELSDARMAQYKRFLATKRNLRPIAGITNLLEDLRLNAVPFALASSATGDVIAASLVAVGLHQIITTRIGGGEVEYSKPAPDIFLLAAARLGVAPHDCVVIEDSTSGVTAAIRAGMRCIGFKNPNSQGQDLSRADRVLTTLEGLTAAGISALFSG
ncbi:MAG: HAD family hydrolase [Desulfopila sp.]